LFRITLKACCQVCIDCCILLHAFCYHAVLILMDLSPSVERLPVGYIHTSHTLHNTYITYIRKYVCTNVMDMTYLCPSSSPRGIAASLFGLLSGISTEVFQADPVGLRCTSPGLVLLLCVYRCNT
jgi:hypothetical protein